VIFVVSNTFMGFSFPFSFLEESTTGWRPKEEKKQKERHQKEVKEGNEEQIKWAK